MVLLTENWLARGNNSRSSEITEMVRLIYLRYFLKVALIIILKSPLSLSFLQTTSSLMSALCLCQQYSLELSRQYFLCVSGLDLARHRPSPTLSVHRQCQRHQEFTSAWKSKYLTNWACSFGVWFFLFCSSVSGVPNAQSLQTLTAISTQLSQYCTTQGLDRGEAQGELCTVSGCTASLRPAP